MDIVAWPCTPNKTKKKMKKGMATWHLLNAANVSQLAEPVFSDAGTQRCWQLLSVCFFFLLYCQGGAALKCRDDLCASTAAPKVKFDGERKRQERNNCAV